MRARTIIAILLCSTLLPTSATAFPSPSEQTNVTYNQAVQETLLIAVKTWHYRTPNCPQGILVTEGQPSSPIVWAEAEQPGCHIDLGKIVYEGLQLYDDETQLLYESCKTMAHEYGHLIGEGHSTDPNSIMYPQAGLGDPTITDPMCLVWARECEQERLHNEDVRQEEEWRKQHSHRRKTARHHVVASRVAEQHTRKPTSTPGKHV